MAECISPPQGLEILQRGEALFVDVRDPASHDEARVAGARPLTQDNLDDFLASTHRDQQCGVRDHGGPHGYCSYDTKGSDHGCNTTHTTIRTDSCRRKFVVCWMR